MVLVYGFISSKTVVGRHVYAVGGNRHAAELSGVKSKKINFLVMMNMSIIAGLAGMIFVARSTSAGPSDGTGWELDAIAAVFIGGAAVTGGVGTVIGSIVGGLVMAVLNNGLQLLSVGADWQSMIKGLVLLVAVAIDVYNKSQGRASIIGLMMKNFNRAVGRARHTAAAGRSHLHQRNHFQGSLSTFSFLTQHPQKKVDTEMRMFGKAGKAAAIAAIAALALTGCGRSEPSTPGGGASGGTGGFPQDSAIGVALPKKTSENWVLAEKLFNDGLTGAGFKPTVQFANNGVAEQQNQISAMIAKGAKVIIVGALDGSQLGTQLQQAKDAGATIIAYDRLLLNTANVDYYVAYDNFKVGVLQGQALLDGMKAKKPAGPYNIELLAGSPDDANAKVFFDGAMAVLQAEDRRRHAEGTLRPDHVRKGCHPGLEG